MRVKKQNETANREYIDEEGCSWESAEEWYVLDVLGLCGCCDTELYDDLLKVIYAFEESDGSLYYDKLPIGGSEKYKELILHIMNDKDILEHGFSARGSWLTEKGRKILRKLKDHQQNPPL